MATEKENWHLDKRLSIGQIATTISIVGALIWTWNSFDKRLTVVETNQNNNNQRILTILENQSGIDRRQDIEINQVKEEIGDDLNYIRARLDMVIDGR